MARTLRSICVFCGASSGSRPEYATNAREIGRAIASSGATLVWGGGNVGLMGVVADAANEAGGRTIGVIPESLEKLELAHRGATELHVVRTMHERKALMADLSEAFVALPGGFGTLDELCEILTWAQLGLHAKPVGLLAVGDYFDPLLAFFDRAVDEGFLRAENRALLVVDSDPARLLQRLSEHVPTNAPKWIGRDVR